MEPAAQRSAESGRVMTMKSDIAALAAKWKPRYTYNSGEFKPGTSRVLYSGPYWDNREVEMALEAFLGGAWLVAGEYVARFQNMFAKKFEVKYAHMVNSGSSANLVLIAAVKKQLDWSDGDEIIVSPVGFPTTIAPLVQNGLVPVFADIETNTLNFDLQKVHAAITNKTKAIFVSPVLGNPPDMDKLQDLCEQYNLVLLGDNCDSLGSKWRGELLNKLYYVWSTSFYPAHHITTGEGGMVCSNDKELIDTARSISWWGRDCYCVGAANLLPCGTCGKRFDTWLGGNTVVDHKYLFTNLGYNLKPLDLQGAIGLAQLEKIDFIEAARRENKHEINKLFLGFRRARVACTLPNADPCWFGVPIICDTEACKNKLVAHFESHLIQTRPYFAGNLLAHPGYAHLGDAAMFPNANTALTHVFFLGCPPHYKRETIAYIGEVLNKCQL